MQPLDIPTATLKASCLEYRASAARERTRILPEETPVALVYDGSAEAVMMATPADLEDFATGFSLTEGLIGGPSEIAELAVLHSEAGIELRMWLANGSSNAYRNRRRRLTGPTGCGLCGIESLAEALRPTRVVGDGCAWRAADITAAVASLAEGQSLHRQTHATHAAAFFPGGSGPATIREDVGRHNAFDKLIGAMRRGALAWEGGFALLSSRCSYELVEKAVLSDCPMLATISAPTALAIERAGKAGLPVRVLARRDSFLATGV